MPGIFFMRLMVYIQVTALSNVEAKKRFEFLEAVSGTMDAHLRYFKQVDQILPLLQVLLHFFETFYSLKNAGL